MNVLRQIRPGWERVRERASVTFARSATWTWLGISLIGTGFAVLALSWSRVAGLLYVPLQLPYVVSGGFGGLILVQAGVSAMRRGAQREIETERARRLEAIATALRSEQP